jgi:hypothetical protein
MDKKSEQRAQSKKQGDTDIGVHKYGECNEREQLDGLWAVPTITGGSFTQRIVNNNYSKCDHEKEKKEGKDSVLEGVLNNGQPIENRSRPRAVASYRS